MDFQIFSNHPKQTDSYNCGVCVVKGVSKRTPEVNGVCYRAMLRNFLWPHLDQMNIENVWFQQNGATCHTSRETIALLREKFPDTLI